MEYIFRVWRFPSRWVGEALIDKLIYNWDFSLQLVSMTTDRTAHAQTPVVARRSTSSATRFKKVRIGFPIRV